MSGNKTLIISYKKLPEFHSFWAHDGNNNWLLINSDTIDDGMERVIEQLNHKFGGEWQAVEGTSKLFEGITDNSEFSALFEASDVTINTSWMQKVA